ncbi:putative phage transglycosylase [Clostridium botulinum]|nr:transglycosylase [Clostridium botulinum]APH22607.1 putative phage transglycosylase [Clostridium botulinum]
MVSCNKCNKDFEIEIKTKYYYKLEIQYFICPHCGKKYTYAVIDDYIREKRKELNNIKEKVRQCTEEKEVNKLIKEEQKIIRNMKQYSDNFIKRLEAGTQ